MSVRFRSLKFQMLLPLFLVLACTERPAPPIKKLSSEIERNDIPRFTGSDTIRFVNDVRRFVAEKATSGNVKHPLCLKFDSIPMSEFPIDTFLNIFDSLQGTATCGLTATIMAKILIDNGIDAYTYDFGFDQTPFTHMVTLVKYRGDYSIFDSYLNYELLSDGDNIGILKLLECIAEQDLIIYFNSDTVRTWFVLDTTRVEKARLKKLNATEYNQLNFETESNRHGILSARFGRCFPCTLNPMGLEFKNAFEEKLREQKRFSEFHEAFALKINHISGAADADSVDRLIEDKLVELRLNPITSTYTAR